MIVDRIRFLEHFRLRLSFALLSCLLLFSCCVFGFCCFSAVTHLRRLSLGAATRVTFCTFRILFSCALLDFSHLFARFQVECHERACSSGSLAGQVAVADERGSGGRARGLLGFWLACCGLGRLIHSGLLLEISHSIVKNNRLNDATVWEGRGRGAAPALSRV